MIQPAPDIAQRIRARPGRSSAPLRRELAEHLRQNRASLLAEWSKYIQAAPTPAAVDKDDLLEQAALVYDDYVAALAAGRVETLPSFFGRELPERLLAQGIETNDAFTIVVLLRELLGRDVLGRSGFMRFRHAEEGRPAATRPRATPVRPVAGSRPGFTLEPAAGLAGAAAC